MITLTDKALEVVRGYMDSSDGEFTALRIGISGGTPLSPDFELTLVGPDDIRRERARGGCGRVDDRRPGRVRAPPRGSDCGFRPARE